jgi:acyl carrier protein
MTDNEVTSTLDYLLIDCIEVTKDQIIPSANFYKIGRDSLDYVWLYAQVEKTFKFKITTEEIIKVKTVADFYSYVIYKTPLNK